MRRRVIIPLLAMMACGSPYEGFDPLDEQVHHRLVRFGEGTLTTQGAAFCEVRCTLGLQREAYPDYDLQFILQHPEADAVVGTALGASFDGLKAGDSVQYILPYALLKDAILDEYSIDSIPVPDTTMMRLNLGILALWTQEAYEALQHQEVVEGRKEEDAYLKEYLAEHGMLDSLTFIDGAYFRVLDRTPDGAALIEGTPIELDRIGTLLDGTVFENSYASETTMYFKLGDKDQVVPGIERVLEQAHYGDRLFCVMPSYLAYGQYGSKDGTVPSFTPVCFELEVKYPNVLNLNTTNDV